MIIFVFFIILVFWPFPCQRQPFYIEKIQNGGRCHGNQGAKDVKFTPSRGSF
jgi:hypothetical protein